MTLSRRISSTVMRRGLSRTIPSNGEYVAHYKGTIQVPMKELYVPPAFNFAKLDTYYCALQMQADGINVSSNDPVISGPLPAPTATSPNQ